MNIAILSRVIFMSGVSTHIVDLCNELVKRGHKVYVFSAGAQFPEKLANKQLVERLIETGVHFIRVPFPIKNTSKIKYLWDLMKTVPLMKQYFKQYKIDVIHIHTPILCFIPILLKKKFVKTIHFREAKLGMFNRKASHEIAISDETFQESMKLFKYKPEEISLIYNGINDRFSVIANSEKKIELKSKLGIPNDKVIIGITGAIGYGKGHDLLLEAVSRLSDEYIGRLHIVVLGDGELEWLNDLMRKFRLEDYVSIFSFQDPKPFYDCMDIFVLPSRSEGFPLVPIEAMFSNCLVIRSITGGTFEQIVNGETGFFFKNENVEELLEILNFYFKNVEKCKNIAKNGREYAMDNFTSNIMCDKTLEVYKTVSKNDK